MDETVEGVVQKIIRIGNNSDDTPRPNSPPQYSTLFELLKDDSSTEKVCFPMQLDPSAILGNRIRYKIEDAGVNGMEEHILEILDSKYAGIVYGSGYIRFRLPRELRR